MLQAVSSEMSELSISYPKQEKQEKQEKLNYLEEISNFIFTCKYARYNEKLKRRETWEETVDRVLKMHLKKYSFLNKEDKEKINWAFDLVKQKRVVPSMRSLQFAGPAIEAHNPRIFNCSVRHIDSIRSFSEVFYLLLCGCGVGLGLSYQFLNRLPNLVDSNDKTGTVITYVVQDTIEGWADSLEALLNCYFKNTAYTGRKIVFDYSKIRKKGEILKTGGGKAPGFKGLKNAHIKIKTLLDHIIEYKHQSRLKSIDAYDIIMHSADAVLSGGIRRSATSVVFDKDDEDLLNAKTYHIVDRVFAFDESGEKTTGGHTTKLFEGKVSFEGQKIDVEVEEWELENLKKNKLINWWHLFPQRGRSNNSVLLKRDEVSKEEFEKIIKRTREFGEPGFVFTNDLRANFNPCVTANTVVITDEGPRLVKDLINKQFNAIVNGKRYSSTKDGFWLTGKKETIKIELKSGRELTLTKNHKLLNSKNQWIEAGDLKLFDELIINNHRDFHKDLEINPNSEDFAKGYLLGSFLGDGNVNQDMGEIKFWGENKEEYLDMVLNFKKNASWSSGHENGGINKTYSSMLSKKLLEFAEEKECLNKQKNISKLAETGSWNYISGLLRGYADADGTVLINEEKKSYSIRYCSSQIENLQAIQRMLASFGINSNIYKNRLPEEFRILPDGKGGEKPYWCKSIHELVISRDNIVLFNRFVGFSNKLKQEKLNKIIDSYIREPAKTSFVDKVVSISETEEQFVFDCTIDQIHAFDANGFYAHNCFEISFIPITDDGICGVQFCVSKDTNLITKTGIEKIGDCVGKQIEVWNGEEWAKCKPFKTQSNVDLYRVFFSDGSYLDVTENHRFLVKKSYQKEFYEKTTKEILNDKGKFEFHVPRMDINVFAEGKSEEFAYEYGYFKGDGHIANKKRKPYANACLYGKDNNLPLRKREITSEMINSYGTKYKEVTFDDLDINFCQKLKNELPKEIFSWDRNSILNFVAGWLDADGSNASNGVRLYGNENSLRMCQLLLTKIGIRSSINLMQKKGKKTNLGIRKNDVWYLQITKTYEIPSKRLNCFNTENNKFKGKFQVIKKIEKLEGKHDSFCLEEKKLHNCLFNNVITKQCNLTSMNGRLTDTYEKFKEHTEASAIIGTLQAGYTNFPYLSNAAKKLTEDEALLGCSITGMMDNPDILLNPKYQKEMAEWAKTVNKEWAAKINIKPAARVTTVKPEGTSSLVLGTGSGIHPHHARRYFRRVQNNKLDNVYRFFKKNNKHMCEESVWSANKTDDVIIFPIEVSESSMIKKDLTALKHLEIIKKTQQNWVITGTSEFNKKDLNHNVSCTVQVAENEWDEVIEYIFKNKQYFTAISLLSKTGDKIFPQAPMEEVVTKEDEELWNKIVKDFVKVDYTQLSEEEDKTSLQQEIACSGGQCEIIYS